MTDRKQRIAYYVTPHGFGHAVRSLEVIRHLLETGPDVEVILVSDLPQFLVEQNVKRPLPVRRKRLDVGLVQQDSLRFDLEATRQALERFHCRHEEIIAEEVRFLQTEQVRAVVSDVPFLAFYAAAQGGIPAIGLGNFTWDWIYQVYALSDPQWQPLVAWIREGYRRCGIFLQLPMHGDCSVCPHIEEVPLIARKAGKAPEEVRRILGVPPGRRAYLISFSSLDLDGEAQRRLEELDHSLLFYKEPLHFHFSNGRSLDGFDPLLSYTDVVAAVDGVITKPGYGIVADCLAHGTPMIYTDRGLFPEYEVLVREMERHLTTVYMGSRDLYSGNWGSAFMELESSGRRVPELRDDGAAVCARSILGRMEF